MQKDSRESQIHGVVFILALISARTKVGSSQNGTASCNLLLCVPMRAGMEYQLRPTTDHRRIGLPSNAFACHSFAG